MTGTSKICDLLPQIIDIYLSKRLCAHRVNFRKSLRRRDFRSFECTVSTVALARKGDTVRSKPIIRLRIVENLRRLSLHPSDCFVHFFLFRFCEANDRRKTVKKKSGRPSGVSGPYSTNFSSINQNLKTSKHPRCVCNEGDKYSILLFTAAYYNKLHKVPYMP